MKKTFEMFLLAKQDSYMREPAFIFHASKMGEYGYVTVKQVSVDVEIPDDFDIREPMISVLEQKRKKAIADHAALMNAIDGEIQKLRCIEHKELS